MMLYARYHTSRRGQAHSVRAVSFDTARTEIRAAGLVPWAWIGALYAGLTVETPRAVYALTRADVMPRAEQTP